MSTELEYAVARDRKVAVAECHAAWARADLARATVALAGLLSVFPGIGRASKAKRDAMVLSAAEVLEELLRPQPKTRLSPQDELIERTPIMEWVPKGEG